MAFATFNREYDVEFLDSLSMGQFAGFLMFLFVAVFSIAKLFCPKPTEVIDVRLMSKEERTNYIINKAAQLREQQELLCEQLPRMYGYSPESEEGEELQAVVLAGIPFSHAMKRIMQLKLRRGKQLQ